MVVLLCCVSVCVCVWVGLGVGGGWCVGVVLGGCCRRVVWWWCGVGVCVCGCVHDRRSSRTVMLSQQDYFTSKLIVRKTQTPQYTHARTHPHTHKHHHTQPHHTH